jgi:hypothetical protein
VISGLSSCGCGSRSIHITIVCRKEKTCACAHFTHAVVSIECTYLAAKTSVGNFSSTPWKIVKSHPHRILDMGSLLGYAGLDTCPYQGTDPALSGHPSSLTLSFLSHLLYLIMSSLPANTQLLPCIAISESGKSANGNRLVGLQFPPSLYRSCHFPRFALLAACFMLVSCLAYTSTLKMEVICSSETSVGFHRTTQCYNPKDRILLLTRHSFRHAKVKENLVTYLETSYAVEVIHLSWNWSHYF